MDRVSSIDTLRGISVLTMIVANSAASTLVQPHPMWLRLIGTFAAPIFIFLSGMMVGYGAGGNKHPWLYYLQRGAWVMFYGVALDVLVFQYIPGTAVDVLYLIGLSLPLAALILRLPEAWRWANCTLVFLLAPLLQYVFGYTTFPQEYHLDGTATHLVENQTSVFAHWMIDGWFPLFPWLGFAIFGALCGHLFKNYARLTSHQKQMFHVAAYATLALGISVWVQHPGALMVRGGYSEMFYPPTLGYCITAIGVIFTLFAWINALGENAASRWLCTFGKAPLLVYVLHYMIIRYILEPALGHVSIEYFLIIYGIFVLVLWIAVKLIQRMRHRYPPKSLGLRLLLGAS